MAQSCLSCPKTKTYLWKVKTNEYRTEYLCLKCDKVMFNLPPVNTSWWHDSDWARYIQKYGIDKEPATINSSFGIWEKTNKVNENGEALYTLKK